MAIDINSTMEEIIEEINSKASGPLTIEEEALPTENIDDSKIYVLNEIKNAEVYYFDGEKYCTLSAVILDIVGVTPTINHYVVNELPTNAEITDLQTFSIVNCYIFDNVSYVYGSVLGSDNMWLPVSFIFEQMGNPTEDKGRVYDLTNASVEVGLYVYYEEFRKFYLYSDSEWKEIGGSTSDKYILSLSGSYGVLTDEQYQGLVDNFPNVAIVLTQNGANFFITSIATQGGAYVAFYQDGTKTEKLCITQYKNWYMDTTDLYEKFVSQMDDDDISGTKTFQGKAVFNSEVDFTNATVTGLPSGGGGLTKTKVTLAELQALITTENLGMPVSIVCKNSTNKAFNDAVAPVLKIGYGSLSTSAPEIFNKVTSEISASGGSVFTITEYLLRINGSGGVVFNKYTTTINLANNTATKTTTTNKSYVTDANFDFYVYK